MKCPECKAPSSVKETRPLNGAPIRRRWCENGHVFKTREVVIPAKAKKPRAALRKDQRILLPLNRLTDEQAKVARDMFKSGWTLREVAPLFDLTVAELRL